MPPHERRRPVRPDGTRSGNGTDGKAKLSGRVFVDRGVPAEQVKLRFYERGFGGKLTPVGEALTEADGSYTLDSQRPLSHYEVRVVGANGKETPVELPGGPQRGEEPLTVVVKSDQVRQTESEYRRLKRAVEPFLAGKALAEAREDEQRRDLSLLHEATEWDARLIALAATSDKLAAAAGLEPEIAYGLARVGLPTEPAQFARVSPTGVRNALAKAAEAGLIDVAPQHLDAAVARAEEFAGAVRREFALPGTLSTYGEMLAATGVTADQQARFDRVFVEHDGTVDALWDRLRDEGLPVEQLQRTARLGYLTLENSALVRQLNAEIDGSLQLSDALVGAGLYQPSAWEARLRDLAGDEDSLAQLIPPAYAGATVEDRLAAYTTDLAFKVRRSYPTQVVSQMIRSEELVLGTPAEFKDEVAFVLDRAASLGFSLGRTPLNEFVTEHSDVIFKGLEPDRAVRVTEDLKTLQRLYQVTRSDEGMRVLAESGFRSAHDIAAIPEAKFVERYGSKFSSQLEAKLTWRKAQQVTTVTYTFLGAAKQAASAPAVAAVSSPSTVIADKQSELVKQYPSMESLFGSLDYCECDHCRSVLSPAAYLVDLLHFLDPNQRLWSDDLAEWREKHGDARYPYVTKQAWLDAGSPAPVTPYQALDERRPDLSELPLTCENTNVVLPYIDVVNEILEYFVVHRALGPGVAYDAGDAVSADLIAEPQHLLPGAYDVLRAAKYPLSLPFDLWLETARRFADHFDTPFWELLDAVRPVAGLYPSGGTGYGRAAVVMERLGFSPADLVSLTAADATADWRALYGFDPATVTEAVATDTLTGASQLARRLGVTYRELVALLGTHFVNPRLDTLVTLRKLGVSTEDVLRYQAAPGFAPMSATERTSFESGLGTDGVAWLNEAWTRGDFRRILVLADPTAECGFETTTLRYADGTAAGPLAFVLLNWFVRIWRRLGWSIEAVDSAVCTFLPPTTDPWAAANLGAAVRSALLGVGNLVHLADLLKASGSKRALLATLWSPIDDRRYAELFLTGTEDSRDPVFDHPLGRYLARLDAGVYRPFTFDPGQPEDVATGNVGLRAHLGAVQAALQLTADEVAAILADTGADLDSAPLDVATLSTLHRYALLARLLKLSVADLITLSALSGVDPFTPLHTGPVTTDATDHPFTDTIRFVEIAQAVRDSGLEVPELDYLLRHRFDPVGPHRAVAQPPLELLRALAAGIRRIRSEHAVPADPLTFTDEVLAGKLALVLEAPVVSTFLAMWTGQAPLDAAFVTEHLLRRTVPGVGSVGFLPPSGHAALFTPTPGDQAAEAARRRVLAESFLPYLQDRLIRDLVLTTVAADTGAELPVVEALLTSPALLDTLAEPGEPLLAAYAGAGESGLTRTGTAPGAQRLTGYIEVPASGAYRFFALCAQSGTQVELRFDHLVDPVVRATSTDAEREPSAHTDLRAGVPYGFALDHVGAGAVTLFVQGASLPKTPVSDLVTYRRSAVERLHRAHLLVRKVIRLVDALELTETELRHLLGNPADFGGLDLGELPTQPSEATAARATALFGQLLRLLAYARLRDDLGAGDDLVDLLRRARRDVAAGVTPATAADELLDDVSAALGAITRREPALVREVVDKLGITAAVTGSTVTAAAFVDERGVARVWRVLAVASRLGVDPAALWTWATPTPDATVARAVRDAVKARYDTEQWRRVAQPIFDKLRQRKRDALVAHIMHQQGFDHLEQLFEFFLVDPGTEPVVQTSRLRLAISSVQTFVQRCLLNLEPKVAPSAINAEHWGWMKRYRVWEANRKIFLWPENWLEPEFRDDKTHLYNELESALLESDLDNEVAERAFFGYLRGLDQIARLDVRSVFLEEKEDPASNVLHVVARTFNAPHKYYYRTYAHRVWTAWVPVDTEIESDHVVAAVWRGRLHVFWVMFLEQSEADPGWHSGSKVTDLTLGQVSGLKPARKVDAQLCWSEYFQGEWSQPATSGFPPAMRSAVSSGWRPGKEFVHALVDDDGAVLVHLTGAFNKAFRVISKNSAPTVKTEVEQPATPPYDIESRGPGRYFGHGPDLEVTYVETITTEGLVTTHSCPITKDILGKVRPHTIVTPALAPMSATEAARNIERLVQPFFLADDRHTLFVEPVLTETTTIEHGDKYILDTPIVDRIYDVPKYWEEVEVGPRYPGFGLVDPSDPVAELLPRDLVTNPGTFVRFNGSYVDAAGGLSRAEFETAVAVTEDSPKIVRGSGARNLGGQR